MAEKSKLKLEILKLFGDGAIFQTDQKNGTDKQKGIKTSYRHTTTNFVSKCQHPPKMIRKYKQRILSKQVNPFLAFTEIQENIKDKFSYKNAKTYDIAQKTIQNPLIRLKNEFSNQSNRGLSQNQGKRKRKANFSCGNLFVKENISHLCHRRKIVHQQKSILEYVINKRRLIAHRKSDCLVKKNRFALKQFIKAKQEKKVNKELHLEANKKIINNQTDRNIQKNHNNQKISKTSKKTFRNSCWPRQSQNDLEISPW